MGKRSARAKTRKASKDRARHAAVDICQKRSTFEQKRAKKRARRLKNEEETDLKRLELARDKERRRLGLQVAENPSAGGNAIAATIAAIDCERRDFSSLPSFERRFWPSDEDCMILRVRSVRRAARKAAQAAGKPKAEVVALAHAAARNALHSEGATAAAAARLSVTLEDGTEDAAGSHGPQTAAANANIRSKAEHARLLRQAISIEKRREELKGIRKALEIRVRDAAHVCPAPISSFDDPHLPPAFHSFFRANRTRFTQPSRVQQQV